MTRSFTGEPDSPALPDLRAEQRAGAHAGDPLRGDVCVVVFLVDSTRPSTAAGGYKTAHQGQNLFAMFCHSVIRVYEQARFTILTTPETRLPEVPFPLEVVARPIGDGPLLYERMRHYIAFLEAARDDCAYLFLESDMLMFERFNPGPGIADDWDVALAYKSTGMWINSGMFLVRAHRREPALAFLRLALQHYASRHLDHAKWGADQAALRDAVGLTAPPAAPRVEHTGTARVLLVPRHEFTRFAPWYARVTPPPTWILHFSGSRKRAMPQVYWLHVGAGAAVGRVLTRLVGPLVRLLDSGHLLAT